MAGTYDPEFEEDHSFLFYPKSNSYALPKFSFGPLLSPWKSLQSPPPQNLILLFSLLLLLLFSRRLSAQCDAPTGCAGTIRLEPLMQYYTICQGDTVEILLQLCFNSETPIDTAVSVILDIPDSTAGLSLIEGDIPETGQGLINLEGVTDCIPLSLFISAGSSATPGEIIPIPVTIGLPESFCDQSDSAHSTIHLYIMNCSVPSCSCDTSEGGVNLKGNLKLSQVINSGKFGNPGSPQNPPCLSINGTLNVDFNLYRFEDMEIKLGPASSIQIGNNASLRLKGNYIHGCDSLWNNIFKYGKGGLTAINNVIEDGLTALEYAPWFQDYPTAVITGNTFNKDFIGIAKVRFLTGQVNFKEFYGNTFTCENANLLPTALSIPTSPKPLSKTFAGVQLFFMENTANFMGVPAGDKNNFHQIQNGIVAEGTNLVVRNARFTNIPVNKEYIDFTYGIGNGIYSNAGFLIQEGNGIISSPPNFEEVGIGVNVYLPLGSVSIKKNNMDDVGTGIRIQTSGSIPSLFVEQNTINNSKAIGISLVNADAKKHSVSSNIITVVGPYGKGIEFMNLVETPLNGNIEWNDIDLYGKNYGIDMNLSEGGIIRENNINLHSDQDFSGVHLTGVTSGSFNCNRITGVSSTYDPGSDQSIAFDINNSTGVEYRCNYLDETSIGFRYTGSNGQSSSSLLQTDVTGNSINSHGYGFMMQSDALFGSFTSQNVMAHKGNTWDGDYGNDKAIHFGLPDQVFYSQFKVHANSLPYYPYSVDLNNPEAPAPPLPNAPGFPWFVVINDGNPYACSQQDCPQEQITENDPDSIGVLGLAIARDSLDFTSEFDEALTWALKRRLYRILDDYPTLQYQDSSLLQFYTDVASSPIGAFTAVDHLKKVILSADTSISAQILLWDQEIENRLDSIRAAEEEFPVEPDSSDIELLTALQGAYLIEIDSLANLQQKLRCTEWSSKIDLVDSASVLNAGTQPVTQMEINENVVNQIYFDKTFFGQFRLTA